MLILPFLFPSRIVLPPYGLLPQTSPRLTWSSLPGSAFSIRSSVLLSLSIRKTMELQWRRSRNAQGQIAQDPQRRIAPGSETSMRSPWCGRLGKLLRMDKSNLQSVNLASDRKVGPTGFGPVTSRLSAGCSNHAKLWAHDGFCAISDWD